MFLEKCSHQAFAIGLKNVYLNVKWKEPYFANCTWWKFDISRMKAKVLQLVFHVPNIRFILFPKHILIIIALTLLLLLDLLRSSSIVIVIIFRFGVLFLGTLPHEACRQGVNSFRLYAKYVQISSNFIDGRKLINIMIDISYLTWRVLSVACEALLGWITIAKPFRGNCASKFDIDVMP